MGAFLSVINDDFEEEKAFGYIEDSLLHPIAKKADENSFACLSYVVGYENTIFNSVQMEEIENELSKLYPIFKNEKTIQILDKIKSAIEFAKKDPPLYLFFEGD